MIGGRRCGIVAVIGGKDNEVLLPNFAQHPRQASVELLKAGVEAGYIITVSPRLVEFDHVGKEQTIRHRPERALDQDVGFPVRGSMHTADSTTREQIIHLSNP